MIHFINEGGNSELKHRVFPLSKGIKKHLMDTLRNYRGDKTIEGYKRLNNLLSMTNGISYSEMKRLKNFFDNYQGTDKSVEFLLNGGEPMKLWVIKNKLNEAADNQFSTEELSNLRYFKERYNYCVEHLGQPQGKGSSRVCFQIDDEKILKLAWNNKGIAQNENENDYYLDNIGIVPHTYDSDDNELWIISEYVLPARQRDFKECLGLTFYDFVKFIRSSCAWRENYTRAEQGAYGDYIYSLDEYSDMCENEDLQPFDEYIGDYRPPESDLTRLCNYGMTMRNGHPTIVLLDAGLSQEIWDNYYDKSRR